MRDRFFQGNDRILKALLLWFFGFFIVEFFMSFRDFAKSMFALVIRREIALIQLLSRLDFGLELLYLFKVLFFLLWKLDISLVLFFLRKFNVDFLLSFFGHLFSSCFGSLNSFLNFDELFVGLDCLSIKIIWSENRKAFFFELCKS